MTLSQTISDVDNLVGGTGTDTLTGNGDPNELDGGTGNAVDTLAGGARQRPPDRRRRRRHAHGDAGVDVLDGGAGDDMLIGGLGADDLDGGGNVDTASYEDRTVPGPA